MEINEKKTIIKNIGWLTISKFIVYFLSIITITLIPRYLGVEGYGQLNFVLSIIGIFAIFGDLGTNTLIFRDVSKNKKLLNKYFNNLFLSKMFFLVVVAILMFFLSLFLNKPLIVKQLMFLGIFYFIFSFGGSAIYYYFSSIQLFKFQAYSDTLSKFLYTVLALIVIYFNLGLLGIFASQVIAFFIVFLFLFFSIKKYIKFNIKLNIPFFLSKLKYSWPFALNIFFTTIFFNFDKIFISLIQNDYQLGLYAVGVTFVGFLLTFMSVFASIFFNLFSKYSGNKNKITLFFNKYLQVSLIISLPIFFAGILLSKQIISLVFGVEYVAGSIALSIMLFFFFIISINSVFNNYFLTNHLERYALKIRGIATGINVILNLIIIPFYGIIGAAITTVISEIFVFIIFYKKQSSLIKFNLFKTSKYILLSSIIMFFSIYVFKYFFIIRIFNNTLDVLFIIIASGLIYILSLFIFKVISIKDIKEIIKLRK